ncbi:uncharacterized protein LOC115709327 [Cannabis sativa]|uniref:uncharacterized protein LOC115709327 n=1 Tax=Cannabis sativa TaxID=3483 RepID=UPI0029CA4FAF|nr:uncharacterized protein LOC115709327 [Cannabis sativa]
MGSHCHTKEKVCEICGSNNPRSEYLLVTCSVCNTTCEHIYCMRRKLKKVPKDWVCESCLTSSDSIMMKSWETDAAVTSSFQEDEAVRRAMSNEKISNSQQKPVENDIIILDDDDDDDAFHEDGDEEMDDAEGFDDDDNMSGDEEIEDYVAGRGPALMHEVIKAQSKGIRTPIMFNEFGQVIGPARNKFASTLGAIVRRTVNINHNSWAKVPMAEKNKFWRIVEETFEIDSKVRKKILQMGGRYWRNFKANLTKRWIEKHRHTHPRKLRHPPRGYISVIRKIDWDKFVKVRLSPEWAEKRKKMQAVRAKVPYNHNMSRGGYMSKKEQLMKEHDGQITEVDRAELWTLGRTNKKEELSGEAASVKANIDHYRQLQTEGKWPLEGSNDEKSGAVRGMGVGVMPNQFFDTPTPMSKKGKAKETSNKTSIDEILRVNCSVCNTTREHVYCMRRKVRNEVSKDWVCESCRISSDSILIESGEEDAVVTSSFQEDEAVTIAMTSDQFSNPVETGKVKLDPHEEVVKLSSGITGTILSTNINHTDDDPEDMDDAEGFDNDENMSGDEEVENYVAGRGPTLMREIFNARSEGIRTLIVFNEFGQVIGPARTKFVSTLGSIVRRTINIKHESWAKVPISEKNKVWKIVEETFEIDPKARKKILKMGRRYWKNFKANLTKCWIEKHRYTKPDKLRHPPRGYISVIRKIDWDNFVKVRLSPEWAEKRKKMQALRAKHSHNHNMSRGGYISKEEQLMKECDGQITEIDRAELWMLGRTNKKGELSVEAASVKAKIDHYRQLQTEGKWTPEGSNDLLTMAIGTPENRGHVRGVGVGVTPTQYFDTPTPMSRKGKAKETSNNTRVDEAVTRDTTNEQVSNLQKNVMLEPHEEAVNLNESKDDDDHPFPKDSGEEMDDAEGFDNDENASGDEEIKNYVAGRGPTLMREVFKARSEGIRTPIVFNEFGQVVGPARTKFISTLGSIVRRTVNIKHDSWAKVPISEKNKLWKIIEETFEIDPKARKKILQKSGKYWKNFKTNLTNCWIEKHRYTKPDKLRHPPRGYISVIKKIDWDNFVKVRLSPEWAEKRKKMQVLRAKHSHNHNMSRGGYISKEEQLMKECDGQITEIDRAELWTLGRTNKKGELSVEAASVKANIDHFKRLQTEGKWKPEGSNDLLTMAIGTPENRGHVRGVGVGVTPTQYFDTPTPVSRKGKAKEALENSKVEALRREFEEKFRQQEEFFKQQQEEFLRRQEAMMKAFMESARGSSSHAVTPELDTTQPTCVTNLEPD